MHHLAFFLFFHLAQSSQITRLSDLPDELLFDISEHAVSNDTLTPRWLYSTNRVFRESLRKRIDKEIQARVVEKCGFAGISIDPAQNVFQGGRLDSDRLPTPNPGFIRRKSGRLDVAALSQSCLAFLAGEPYHVQHVPSEIVIRLTEAVKNADKLANIIALIKKFQKYGVDRLVLDLTGLRARQASKSKSLLQALQDLSVKELEIQGLNSRYVPFLAEYLSFPDIKSLIVKTEKRGFLFAPQAEALLRALPSATMLDLSNSLNSLQVFSSRNDLSHIRGLKMGQYDCRLLPRFTGLNTLILDGYFRHECALLIPDTIEHLILPTYLYSERSVDVDLSGMKQFLQRIKPHIKSLSLPVLSLSEYTQALSDFLSGNDALRDFTIIGLNSECDRELGFLLTPNSIEIITIKDVCLFRTADSEMLRQLLAFIRNSETLAELRFDLSNYSVDQLFLDPEYGILPTFEEFLKVWEEIISAISENPNINGLFLNACLLYDHEDQPETIQEAQSKYKSFMKLFEALPSDRALSFNGVPLQNLIKTQPKIDQSFTKECILISM